MTNGLVYLFSGPGFAERMVVALASMRYHWRGSACCFVTDTCRPIIEPAAKHLDVVLLPIPEPPPVRHGSYVVKTWIPPRAPYDRNLFVDGDTIMAARPDAIFEHPEPLMLTQFSTWITTGRLCSSRIRAMKGRSPAIDALADQALAKTYPAINTGVFLFNKGNTDLAEWATITEACAGQHMTDELAMQLLWPSLEKDRVRILDETWNCSPIYVSSPDARNRVVVWHFHGQKHLRKSQGRELWWPVFEDCRVKNLGGLGEWAGKYDKWVREELAQCQTA